MCCKQGDCRSGQRRVVLGAVTYGGGHQNAAAVPSAAVHARGESEMFINLWGRLFFSTLMLRFNDLEFEFTYSIVSVQHFCFNFAVLTF